MNTTRPLVPEDRYRRQPLPAGQHIRRAAWAAVTATLGEFGGRDPVAAARRLWPDDEVSPLVLQRAAISGALTSVPAWAGSLISRQTVEWLGSLTPASAAAELIRRGPVLPVTELGGPVNIPIRATAPAVAGWVDEAGAIAVRQWSFGTAALNPKKLGIIVTMTKELARYSGAEAVFQSLLQEEAALSLDAAYFGTDDGSTAGHHAGLLAGVTPIAATTGGGASAMISDLTKLAAAVTVGGSGQVVFVTGPGRAATTAMRSMEVTVGTILPSLAVPETRVIALDPASIVHGFDGSPEILASEEPVMHMESVPLQIATGAQGSGVLATPTQSMFQTAMIAFRMLAGVAFAKRRADCVAYIDNAVWTT
jgi:hypothetical protein